MKTKTLALFFFSLLFFAYSCSKSSDSPANPIVGLWIGTFTSPQLTAGKNLYYSFDIRTDGSLLSQGLGNDGNTYYSNGTWALSGTSFTATITGQNLSQAGAIQNVTATYNSSAGTLTGQLVLASNSTQTFTFTLNRIN